MNPTRIIDGVRFVWVPERLCFEMHCELDPCYDLTVTVEDSTPGAKSLCNIRINHRSRDMHVAVSETGRSRVAAVRNAWCQIHRWYRETVWVKQCGGKP